MNKDEKADFNEKVFNLMKKYNDKHGDSMISSLLANLLTIELDRMTTPKELKASFEDAMKAYEKYYNEEQKKENKDDETSKTKDLPATGSRHEKLSRLKVKVKGWPGYVQPPPWVIGEDEELDDMYCEVMLELNKYNYTLAKELKEEKGES